SGRHLVGTCGCGPYDRRGCVPVAGVWYGGGRAHAAQPSRLLFAFRRGGGPGDSRFTLAEFFRIAAVLIYSRHSRESGNPEVFALGVIPLDPGSASRLRARGPG